MSNKDFNFDLPFPEVFPKEWKEQFSDNAKFDFLAFRNLDHFKDYVSRIKADPNSEDNCGLSYAEALKDLMQGKSEFPDEQKLTIREKVRSNLHKRGLITEEVYENFRYATDGTQVGVDVGKYAAGEPDCVITPSRQYIDFFYELYISISYPHYVGNDLVRENVAMLLAAIEELERQHIFIKVVLVFPTKGSGTGYGERKPDFFSAIPLFSHKDYKSVDTMSSVVNDRLLRKFYFAILETHYGKDLTSGYGTPVDLDGCINIGHTIDPVEIFENVLKSVGA